VDNHSSGRRSFLQSSALGGVGLITLPYEKLLDAIAKNIITQAHAAEMGTASELFYINYGMIGAPSRYCFDHWIKVNANDPAATVNPFVVTEMQATNGVYDNAVYSTFSYRGLEIPTFFKNQVTTSSGPKALTGLADNMLVIRGYGTGADGHVLNFINQLIPSSGLPSISGAHADQTQAPFAAVQYPNRFDWSAYSSELGKSIVTSSDSKPAHDFLRAFKPLQNTKGRDLKNQKRDLFDAAQAKLKSISGNKKAAASRGLNLENANKLMKLGLTRLEAFWPNAMSRYNTIVTTALRETNIPGLSDKPVVNSRLSTDFDVGFLGVDPKMTKASYDLRSSLALTYTLYMAESFALAEFMIRENLSQTIEIGQLDGVMIRDIVLDRVDVGVNDKSVGVHVCDMHASGRVAALFYSSMYFRALSACILELKTQLSSVASGSGTLWDKTVLQVSSDFGRAARDNGTGSDHGFNQMVTSVISGLIKEPMVIGNISNRGPQEGAYSNTQGVRAPIAGSNIAGLPTPAMPASAIAAILKIEKNPYANLAEPLVQVVGDRVQYAKPSFKGKLVIS
jgi:hypothetical protein